VGFQKDKRKGIVGSGPVKKTVKSIIDDFKWADDNLDVIDSMLTKGADGKLHWGSPAGPVLAGSPAMSAAELYAKAVAGKTVSYAYAGIDAPGTSLIMSCLAASDRGVDAVKPQALWAIENDRACIMELRIQGLLFLFIVRGS
jgi:hypothetical protein